MPVGGLKQLQVRAAVVAQVISRALMVIAYCFQAVSAAGKSSGFRRSRTCMVPSAPEARMPCDVPGPFSLMLFVRCCQERRKWLVGPV